jgi:hypothetical protein
VSHARPLAHPAFRDWLKQTLRSAITCESLQVANDLELLNHLARPGSLSRIDADLLDMALAFEALEFEALSDEGGLLPALSSS